MIFFHQRSIVYVRGKKSLFSGVCDMADKKQYIKWFLAELPQLTEKGIIQRECAALLEEHYRSRLAAFPAPQKVFALVSGIIGIVMVTAGVILFLNYNWDMFPKAVRITFAALPLVAGAGISYFTIISGNGRLWRETSAILTSAGAGTLIAVLSQIYHTGGELHEFMFLLLLLSLPLIFIFNSVGLASLYVVLSFWVNGWNITPWWNGLTVLLLLPWLLFSLREKSSVKVWCRYLTLLAGISFFAGCGGNRYYFLSTAMLMCSIFFVNGMDLAKEEGAFFKNPWLVPAFAVQTVLLAVGSSTDWLFRSYDSSRSAAEMWTFYGSNLILGAIFIVSFLKRRVTLERSLSLLFILVCFIPLMWREPVMRMIFNCCLGIGGVVFMRKGIKSASLLAFNGGAVMICVLTGCRFFDSDLGVLFRSAGLVLLGIGFMVSNWFFVRYCREASR